MQTSLNTIRNRHLAYFESLDQIILEHEAENARIHALLEQESPKELPEEAILIFEGLVQFRDTHNTPMS